MLAGLALMFIGIATVTLFLLLLVLLMTLSAKVIRRFEQLVPDGPRPARLPIEGPSALADADAEVALAVAAAAAAARRPPTR